ncbi:MAG: branched-chain amino acid ABC transporter permease [Candidatus Eiseniibacteriota bacterium]
MVEALQFLLGGLVVGSIYGLVGIGFTGVYNVTGIVNFAQGDFAMMGAMAVIALYAAGVPLLPAIVLAIVVMAVVAAGIERLAIRPLKHDVIRGIIVTIGIGVVLQGTAVLLWGTDAEPMPSFSGDNPLELFGATLLPQALWVVGTAAVLMIGLHLFFQRTYLGKMFRACAVNPFAAGIVGIRVRTMRVISFALSGVLGAVAGIIIAPIALTQFDSGLSLGIKGFVACIIGGFGNPIGAALGGLVLGVLEAFATGYLSSGYKNAIAFVLLLLFLFLRPGGLLGEMERVRQ